jgi:hypothetical protein
MHYEFNLVSGDDIIGLSGLTLVGASSALHVGPLPPDVRRVLGPVINSGLVLSTRLTVGTTVGQVLTVRFGGANDGTTDDTPPSPGTALVRPVGAGLTGAARARAWRRRPPGSACSARSVRCGSSGSASPSPPKDRRVTWSGSRCSLAGAQWRSAAAWRRCRPPPRPSKPATSPCNWPTSASPFSVPTPRWTGTPRCTRSCSSTRRWAVPPFSSSPRCHVEHPVAVPTASHPRPGASTSRKRGLPRSGAVAVGCSGQTRQCRAADDK